MADLIPHDMADDPKDPAARRRAEIGGRGLRSRVASGTVVNSVYQLCLNALSIVQGLLVAGLLGASVYGLWGLLTISFGTLFALAAVGVNDKYIQQDYGDQQAAFEIAFTLQAALCGLFTLIALAALPLFSLLYDQPAILVPGLVLSLALPLAALQVPTWAFYRRMNFLKQRLLEGCLPITSFVVSVSLAVAGVGVWSLVIGAFSGAVVAASMAVRYSPYPLRLRLDSEALREYVTFSWPLLVVAGSGILAYQVPLTLASRTLGAAALGAITLASQITQYTRRVDDVVTHALYPAVCAVKDQRDLLFEAFSKSNRLALLWGFPAGLGAAVFAAQGVPLVLGDGWMLAVPLIQVLGVSAAVDQIGFNWTAFVRARGETRILALAAVASFVAVLGVGLPMMAAHGLPGFAAGLAAGTVANLVVRLVYLRRLFATKWLTSHVVRAAGPAVAATALILLERAVFDADRTTGRFAAELVFYAGAVVLLSWLTERSLLREALGYVRGVRRPRPA